MKKELIVKLHRDFEAILKVSDQEEIEFCYARDLQKVLGYAQWRSFEGLIEKAITSCELQVTIQETILHRCAKWFPLGPVQCVRSRT